MAKREAIGKHKTLPGVCHRCPVEICNLSEVRKEVSVYAKQECPLTEGLVLGLHRMLMKGVPEVPWDPLKPGQFRGPTDDKRFAGFKYLKKHRPPSWRVRSDLNALLEDTEKGRLTSDWRGSAGRFLYRFVRIHPLCDGNGRIARALSTLLLARDHPEVLLFERPIDEVILEHRGDYLGVLEYCDAIYEDLEKEAAPEEVKLQVCEAPFAIFYAKVVVAAFHEQAGRNTEKILGPEPTSSHRLAPLTEPTPDLRLEAIEAEYDWHGEVKKRSLRACAARARIL